MVAQSLPSLLRDYATCLVRATPQSDVINREQAL
jgi:hypothetical protein